MILCLCVRARAWVGDSLEDSKIIERCETSPRDPRSIDRERESVCVYADWNERHARFAGDCTRTDSQRGLAGHRRSHPSTGSLPRFRATRQATTRSAFPLLACGVAAPSPVPPSLPLP